MAEALKRELCALGNKLQKVHFRCSNKLHNRLGNTGEAAYHPRVANDGAQPTLIIRERLYGRYVPHAQQRRNWFPINVLG